jgi:hypothetical protein
MKKEFLDSFRTEPLKANGGANPFEILKRNREEQKAQASNPTPEAPLPELPEDQRVYIRRHQQDFRVGYVSQNEIDDLHWGTISGGARKTSSQPFIHGYVSCDRVRGEISHSCAHGEGPHRIKVLITKKDNSKEIFNWAHSFAGPKPKKS